jgi:hypothetical protein
MLGKYTFLLHFGDCGGGNARDGSAPTGVDCAHYLAIATGE